MPKRCALGCQPKSDIMHRFPNFERFSDRFKEWVQIVGGKLETESDYKKFQSRVVCDKHFTDNFRNRYNRLNALAVPTLYLKGVKHGTLSDESNKSNTTLDPLSTSNCSLAAVNSTLSDESNKSNTTLDPVAISNSSLEDCETSTQVAKPETTLNHLSTVQHCVTGLSKQKITNQNSKPVNSKGESTLSKPKLNLLSLIAKEPLVSSPACNYNYNSKKEHNYSVQEKPDTTKELKYHKPVVPPHIVHQLQTTRKKIKLLQNEVSRLRKRNALIKEILINAKNNNKHSCLEKLTRNMTAAAKIFTHLQFSQTLKKNAGRRFTQEEQELSLSIFRSSPQCYNFLSKLFTLPSVKTLKKILRNQQQVNVMSGLDSSGHPLITDDQPEPHDSSGHSVITFNQRELYKNNGETEVIFDQLEHYEDNDETVMMVDRSEHYENNGETVIMVDQSEFYENNGETVIMVDQSELYENNGETVITADQHERYETSENTVIGVATTYEL